MPTANVNGIDLNYRLEGDGPETIVLVNGLADDLETGSSRWTTSSPPATGCCVSTTAASGESDKPAGPYTTALFADDAKALVDHLGITDFHLIGVSMGGMIAQEYAIAYGADLALTRPRLHVCGPRALLLAACSRCGRTWPRARRARSSCATSRSGRSPYRSSRSTRTRPKEFEDAMAAMTQPLDAYLAQLIEHPDARHYRAPRPDRRADPRARGRGGHPHPSAPLQAAARRDRRAQSGPPSSGGHACMWEHPTAFNQTTVAFFDRHRA